MKTISKKIEDKENKIISINQIPYLDILLKTSNFSTEVLIKSKDRVKKLAEVYTAKKEVEAILNLIPSNIWQIPEATFLEPSCGDGNFIEAILIKKLTNIKKPYQIKTQHINYEYQLLTAISSVYGIDICGDNIDRCKKRVLNLVNSFYSYQMNTLNQTNQFTKVLMDIINSNYIQADTLNDVDKILIVEWERPFQNQFRKNIFKFSEISQEFARPIKQEKVFKYNGR